MLYKVTKQYGRSKESDDKKFADLKSAKQYADQSAESDAAMRVATIYRVYEFDDVVHEVDASKIELRSPSSEGGASGGKQRGAGFTPLPVVPRPKGMPQRTGVDPDEEEGT